MMAARKELIKLFGVQRFGTRKVTYRKKLVSKPVKRMITQFKEASE